MKKSFVLIITWLIAILLPMSCLAAMQNDKQEARGQKVTEEQLEILTDSEKASLRAEIEIARRTKQAGYDRPRYSDILGIDLSELSLKELDSIKAYLSGQKKYVVETDIFLKNFNLVSAIIGTDHLLSTSNTEVSRSDNATVMSITYHNCEILTVTMNPIGDKVTGILCTYSPASSVSGAMYSDDFVYLLIESLVASGAINDLDEAASLFSEIGFLDRYEDGDSGETVSNGIKIMYRVTSGLGVMFGIGE